MLKQSKFAQKKFWSQEKRYQNNQYFLLYIAFSYQPRFIFIYKTIGKSFLLKTHLQPIDLDPSGKSSKTQVWFCKREST